jgi:topoisomerase IA-like protein
MLKIQKKQNISIPKKYDIEKITLEKILGIIVEKNGTKK